MLYRCPYCDWVGSDPQSNEYPDTDRGTRNYERDLEEFIYDQANHCCK